MDDSHSHDSHSSWFFINHSLLSLPRHSDYVVYVSYISSTVNIPSYLRAAIYRFDVGVKEQVVKNNDMQLTPEERRELAELLDAQQSNDLHITQVHGLMCGVHTGPDEKTCSQWWPKMFANHSDLIIFQEQRLLEMLYRFEVETLQSLQNAQCTPIIYQAKQFIDYANCDISLLQTWCDGYMRGIALSSEWGDTHSNADELIKQIRTVFTHLLTGEAIREAKDGKIADQSDASILERQKKVVIDVLNALYRYWQQSKEKQTLLAAKTRLEAKRKRLLAERWLKTPSSRNSIAHIANMLQKNWVEMMTARVEAAKNTKNAVSIINIVQMMVIMMDNQSPRHISIYECYNPRLATAIGCFCLPNNSTGVAHSSNYFDCFHCHFNTGRFSWQTRLHQRHQFASISCCL